VFVNGYLKGRTPCTARVSSATAHRKPYKITVILPGYEKWVGTVTLKASDAKTLEATLTRAAEETGESLKGRIVCIDPGHPSEASEGTTGPNGTTEVHINWVVAAKLKALLIADGAKVVLTKTSESQSVTNKQRALIANHAGASLMLRLHCDSGPIDGAATYYPDKQGHKDGVTGPSESIIAKCRAAAKAFHPAFAAALQGSITDRGIHGDSATLVGGKQGALTGSIYSKVPVLTIEMCVLSNAHDEAFIRRQAGQTQMAKALRAGVLAVLGR
jgi:N-acetylmuramoyl-L-alanine amidase